MNSALQQNDQFPVKITSASGTLSDRKSGVELTGEYLNSEGLTGAKIWGTTGKWASVSGKIGDENLTVAMFDSSKNKDFPSYMMVRPYGLLALNPLGRKAFQADKPERKFTLSDKQSIAFQHRLVLFPQRVDAAAIDGEYKIWTAK